ncbi:MAG: peptide-methionine (R)-S-oxide reductase MsrB, partial [Flavobacteriales bacterium]
RRLTIPYVTATTPTMDTSNHSAPKSLLNILSVLLIGGTILASCASTPGAPVENNTAAAGNSAQHYDHSKNPYWSSTDTAKLNVAKSEWKKILSPALYHIAFEDGTDAPFTYEYTDYKGKGTFYCAVCGNPLYDATTEFHSGTGWPSFYQPLTPTSVDHVSDGSLGMARTAISCSRCGAHLGHVFDDGPQPTGLRYCMDGTALDLVKR